MRVSRLFNVILPENTRFEIKQKITALEKGAKANLYFLQNRSFLFANQNQWFKNALNSGRFLVLGGTISHWAIWKILKPAYLARFYSFAIVKRNFLIRVPVFFVLLALQLISNYINLITTLFIRFNYTSRTKTQSIDNSDFTFDLLKIAEEKNWKTLVITGTKETDESTKQVVETIYPDIDFLWWDYHSSSLALINEKKQKSIESKGFFGKILDRLYPDKEILTNENLYEKYPELWSARNFVKQEQPDLILTNFNGEEGKQEFFIHNLTEDKELDFILAASLKDKKPSAKNAKIGKNLSFQLEKTRKNLELLWLTTIQEFTQLIEDCRPTAVNILANQKDEYLLIKRRNYIPGNYGYTFVQGGMKKNEQPEESGIREIHEETSLDINKIRVLQIPIKTCKEIYPISIKTFLLLGCRYCANQNYLNFFEYDGSDLPKVNYLENIDASWYPKSKVETLLSIEKRGEWKVYN